VEVEVRKALPIVIVVAVLLALVGTAGAKTVVVGLTRDAFVPADVSIAVGDVVTWENRDTAAHQLSSPQAGFPDQTLAPGGTFSFTFAQAGRFNVLSPRQGRDVRMSVTVTAPSAFSVTLLAAQTLAVYGNRLTLNGTVSTGQPNEQVTIFAKPCGATTAARVMNVATTTGGAYTALVTPLKNTVYTAQVKTVTSPVANVFVKPRLTLRKVAAGRFALTVRGSTSFSGRAVVLQRWNASLRKWVNIRSALLVKGPAATAPTVLSQANLRATVKARTRLRVTISQFQVGTCYRPNVSNVILA
jgi:plastocyanin